MDRLKLGTSPKSIKEFFKPLSEADRAAADATLAAKNAEDRQTKEAVP